MTCDLLGPPTPIFRGPVVCRGISTAFFGLGLSQEGWGGPSCGVPTGTCEPKCQHGLCDAVTGSCVCEEGYTGGGEWGRGWRKPPEEDWRALGRGIRRGGNPNQRTHSPFRQLGKVGFDSWQQLLAARKPPEDSTCVYIFMYTHFVSTFQFGSSSSMPSIFPRTTPRQGTRVGGETWGYLERCLTCPVDCCVLAEKFLHAAFWNLACAIHCAARNVPDIMPVLRDNLSRLWSVCSDACRLVQCYKEADYRFQFAQVSCHQYGQGIHGSIV